MDNPERRAGDWTFSLIKQGCRASDLFFARDFTASFFETGQRLLQSRVAPPGFA
jgi:hypothetical protein